MDISWLDRLRRFWIDSYDWSAAQAELNRFPQYIAHVHDYDVHFYYVKGEGKNARPLLLTHGWPGSVVEFSEMIEPLTNPSKFGGDPADAFTVIVPSLPGFGFSSMPAFPINVKTTAKIFNELITEVIGHDQYFAHGGDFGGGLTVAIADQFPVQVKAIHINFTPWFAIAENEQTSEEKEWLAGNAKYSELQFDYMRMQANKPMMPAVALVDSPLGTAAWIAEKFWAWSDHKGDLDKVIAPSTLITNIMLYLVNDSGIDGSFWYYRGFRDEMEGHFFPGYLKTPTAIVSFPYEYPMCRPEESTAKRAFNVSQYTKMTKGGHFPALETPSVLTQDIRKAFRNYTLD